MARRHRELAQDVAGQRFLVTVAAMSCPSCKTDYFDASSIERGDLDIARWLALNGPPSGAALRAIRKALGERAVDIATLLGVTAETVSRWETGQRRVDRLAWLVIGTLLMEKIGMPSRMRERLSAFGSADARPAVVKLDARR